MTKIEMIELIIKYITHLGANQDATCSIQQKLSEKNEETLSSLLQSFQNYYKKQADMNRTFINKLKKLDVQFDEKVEGIKEKALQESIILHI